MNKKTWKPYAAIVLILLYGVDIFWLSRFCVYYFGEWGIPMYEGLLAVLALGIVVLFREDVKRAFPFHRPTIAKTVGTLLMWIEIPCQCVQTEGGALSRYPCDHI